VCQRLGVAVAVAEWQWKFGLRSAQLAAHLLLACGKRASAAFAVAGQRRAESRTQKAARGKQAVCSSVRQTVCSVCCILCAAATA